MSSVSCKYGGLDNYLLNTKTELLGQQGMRLRILVRERRNLNALQDATNIPPGLSCTFTFPHCISPRLRVDIGNG